MEKNIFSPTEEEVLKIIGRKKCISTKEIADKFYETRPAPTHYRMIISNSINRINAKCKKYSLHWRLDVWNFGCKGKLVGKVFIADL